MSARMTKAMEAGTRCKNKALTLEPQWFSRYLRECERLLMSKPFVNGDEFKKHCISVKLHLPSTLHHNTWVSMPTFMAGQGWIKRVKYVEPTGMHNHMHRVTQWKSLLYTHLSGVFAHTEVLEALPNRGGVR